MNRDNDQQQADETSPKPAGYDLQGRPLYYHPPEKPAESEPAQVEPEKTSDGGPQYVHFSRPIDPQAHEIPPEIKARHEESLEKYPSLNLSPGEYVIRAVHRHPIGAIISAGVALLLICLIGAVTIALPSIGGVIGFSTSAYLPLVLVGGLTMLLIAIGGYIAVWVYNRNEFYLTNESVIQEIQTSLFSRHEQTVSLGSIEDASFQKNGPVQYMFDYGMIRLSTEGDETTYRFPYTANPKREIAILNNAVEAFKNGRPVLPPSEDMS